MNRLRSMAGSSCREAVSPPRLGHPQELGGVVVAQLDDGEEVVGAQQGEAVEDLAAELGYLGVDVGQVLGGVLDRTVPLSGEPREHDEPGHTDQLLSRQARAEAGCQYLGVGNCPLA